MVRCPAHEDRTPSCSVSEDANGRVLVHCFSGCRQDDVIQALRSLGLWPELIKQEWTPAEKQAWGRRRKAAERLAADALAWLTMTKVFLESKKAYAYDRIASGDSRWFWTWANSSRELYLLQSAGPDASTAKYLEARTQRPAETRSRMRQGKAMQRENLSLATVLVAILAMAKPAGPHAVFSLLSEAHPEDRA